MSELLNRVQANGDIVMSEDRLYYFWPTCNRGMYSSSDLREIARELERRNIKLINEEDTNGC